MKHPEARERLLRRTNYRPTYPSASLRRMAQNRGRLARVDIGDGVRREGWIRHGLFFVVLDGESRCFPLARVRVEG